MSIHDGDNMSDHSPVMCHIDFNTSSVSNQYHNVSARTFVKRAKWDKASDIDIEQYKSSLSEYLNDIYVPIDSLHCSSHHCSDHSVDIDNYCNCIIDACLQSSRLCIPHSNKRPLGLTAPLSNCLCYTNDV